MTYARKYTDKQRAAIIRQHEEGISAMEIARRCVAGSAGVEPFTIPDRSVSQIIQTHDRQQRRKLPQDLSEASSVDVTNRNRARMEALISDELARLSGRVKPLGDAELKRLERLFALNERLRRSRPKTSYVRRKGTAERNALDELAKRMGEHVGGNGGAEIEEDRDDEG